MAANRLDAFIRREGFVSVMNDTKWEVLRVALLRIPGFQPLWREQYLVSDPISPHSAGNREWTVGVPLYRALEWVDIDPIKRTRRGALVRDSVADYTISIKRLLWENHIPFSVEGRYLRVWGYIRPNAHVQWADPSDAAEA